jgi:hypothetical protein
MKNRTRVIILSVALLAVGCASYTYNNKTYSSAGAALGAQSAFLQSIEDSIQSQGTMIPGRAIVITPSKATCVALGVVRKASPPPEFVDYAAESAFRDYAAFPGYLRKARAFSEVEAKVSDQPMLEAKKLQKDYAATIYLHMLSPSQVGWYLLTPGADEPKQINFDATSEGGAPRVSSWIRDVMRQASPGSGR